MINQSYSRIDGEFTKYRTRYGFKQKGNFMTSELETIEYTKYPIGSEEVTVQKTYTTGNEST